MQWLSGDLYLLTFRSRCANNNRAEKRMENWLIPDTSGNGAIQHLESDRKRIGFMSWKKLVH